MTWIVELLACWQGGTKRKKYDLKAILYPLLYHHFLELGTTLEIVAEITSGNILATYVEAGNNVLTAPDSCNGHACSTLCFHFYWGIFYVEYLLYNIYLVIIVYSSFNAL